MFHNGQHLHVAYMKEVQRALEDIGHDNFQLVKGDSSVVIHDLEGPFDVVFIDGNHSYDQTMRDFEAVISKCSSNAIILFHNATAYEAEFLYNGGPWKVCQEIKDRSDLIDFGLTERMWRFQIS